MIDERARFGEAKPGIQTETAKELYNKLKEEVLTAPKRVQEEELYPVPLERVELAVEYVIWDLVKWWRELRN